MTAYMEYL